MPKVLVAIPVLGRPQNAGPVIESLRASDPDGICEPVFLCSPGDDAQHEAAVATGAIVVTMPWPRGPGDYARKINYTATASFGLRLGALLDGRFADGVEWVFSGADDLRFRRGWAEEAIAAGESERVGMVGTDDLGNGLVRAGRHSTHSLFHLGYVECCGTVDEPGKVYHEGYGHQGCDVEAYETAVARGCFVFAARSQVEHLHPFWGKGNLDATYEMGLSTTNEDKRLLNERRRLWQRVAA
jgi:hypothetical protein